MVNRITPAYAGTTPSTRPSSARRQDHPRLRGNYQPKTLSPFLSKGSPPLTRELRGSAVGRGKGSRITPAYAGTTGVPKKAMLICQDHPRLRGNYPFPPTTRVCASGSPPLTRELLRGGKRRYARMGITPAYAGTTSYNFSSITYSWDHPRLRGNYSHLESLIKTSIGSPPLTRELQNRQRFSQACYRITPAYAGTTHPYLPLAP